MTDAINGLTPVSTGKDFFRNSTFDKPDEAAPLPNFSTFANRKIEEILAANNVENGKFDLLDDKTGMPSSDILQWQLALMQSDAESLDKNSVPAVQYDGDGWYKYDSNGDGQYETSVWFDDNKKLGGFSIYDEYDTDLESMHIMENNCKFNYGKGTEYYEFADMKITDRETENRVSSKGTNAFIFSEQYGIKKEIYNVKYNNNKPESVEKL